MRVRVREALEIDSGDVSPRILERLRQALSYPNPVRLERLRRGLLPGAEPALLCFLEEQGGVVRLPRGAIHVLRRLAADEGTTVICDDRRAYPEVSWAGLPTLGLRPDQAAVVEKSV